MSATVGPALFKVNVADKDAKPSRGRVGASTDANTDSADSLHAAAAEGNKMMMRILIKVSRVVSAIHWKL